MASIGLLLLTLSTLAPPEVTAPACAQVPVIDGRLDDACWADGQWLTGFHVLDAPDRPAAAQTHFKLRHSAGALYLAVRADEPFLDKLKATVTERDGKVFTDDCIELMLDADADRTEYVHVAVNALGTFYDSQVRQGGGVMTPAWNAGIRCAGARGEAGWTVEVALPLAEMGLGEGSVKGMGFNLARERQAVEGREFSSFVPLTGGFHQPTLYAALKLVGADLDPYLWSLRAPFGESVQRAGDGLALSAKTFVTNHTGRFRFFRVTAALEVGGKSAEGRVTGGLDARQGRELAFAVPVPAQGAGMLTLTLTDRARGQVWAVRRYPVSLAWSALKLRLDRPSYRDSIFATQRLDAIAGRVLSGLNEAELAGRALRLELRQGDKVLATAAVDKPAQESAFKLPLPALAPGDYTLAASVVAGDRVEHRAELPLKRVPPGQSEVRLDEHRVTRINGEPFLPFGWFSVYPPDYPTVAGYGCTAVADYGAQWRSDEEQLAYLDEAARAGLRIVCYPYVKGSRFTSNEAFGRPLSEEEAELIRGRVTLCRDHPGLLAWYLADEPELRPALPERLEAIRKVIAKADPYHPCIVLNDTIEGIHKYAAGGDILMPDPYPLFMKGGLAARDIAKTTDYLKAVNQSSDGWRGAWVVPQAFNYGDYGRLNNREPTLAEMRNQWWQAVIQGATGCLWYTHTQAANYANLKLGMPFIARETRLLERWILAPQTHREVAFTPAAAPLHTSLREAQGGPLLIAVSTGTEPLEAELALPAGAPATWYAVSEGRTVTATGGKLRDRFETYATHLYTPVAKLAASYSMAAAEQAIAAAEAARRKPGNLAFEDLGARVEVSSKAVYGSTPDRVLDGVTGGIQWKDNTADKYPDWLDVIFAAPVEVGRVVVYSKTIAEGTVQGRTGDQWRDLGALKRLDDDRLEATVATMKVDALRVLVSKSSDRWTTISEVEAYAK